MKHVPLVLFGLLLAMCGVVGFLLVTGDPPASTQHPAYPSLARGSLAEQQEGLPLFLGWILGVLEIAFLVGCLVLGVGPRVGRAGFFLAVGFLYVGVFTALVVAHAAYLRDARGELVLSLPAPTAWLLYGLWPLPAVFAVWYALRFRAVIFTADDAERFRVLTSRQKGS